MLAHTSFARGEMWEHGIAPAFWEDRRPRMHVMTRGGGQSDRVALTCKAQLLTCS